MNRKMSINRFDALSRYFVEDDKVELALSSILGKRPGNYTYLLKFHGNRLSISGAGWHSSLRQAMM